MTLVGMGYTTYKTSFPCNSKKLPSSVDYILCGHLIYYMNVGNNTVQSSILCDEWNVIMGGCALFYF